MSALLTSTYARGQRFTEAVKCSSFQEYAATFEGSFQETVYRFLEKAFGESASFSESFFSVFEMCAPRPSYILRDLPRALKEAEEDQQQQQPAAPKVVAFALPPKESVFCVVTDADTDAPSPKGLMFPEEIERVYGSDVHYVFEETGFDRQIQEDAKSGRLGEAAGVAIGVAASERYAQSPVLSGLKKESSRKEAARMLYYLEDQQVSLGPAFKRFGLTDFHLEGLDLSTRSGIERASRFFIHEDDAVAFGKLVHQMWSKGRTLSEMEALKNEKEAAVRVASKMSTDETPIAEVMDAVRSKIAAEPKTSLVIGLPVERGDGEPLCVLVEHAGEKTPSLKIIPERDIELYEKVFRI